MNYTLSIDIPELTTYELYDINGGANAFKCIVAGATTVGGILATVGAAATNPFLGVATGYSSACAIIEVWEWALE
ncbi:MAG: hypothetical protein GX336_00185 [Halanaerobiaceae bacterium]|nr:hypothetical protein [Halanaerobiaceae bacterium]